MRRLSWPRVLVGLAVLIVSSLLAACASQRDPDPRHLLVWSLDAQTDRISATRAIIQRFEQQSDVEVELVPVDEAQLPQLVAGAAQSGNLPDVIGGLSLANVRALDSYEVLDRDAATAVMDELGDDTFAPKPVELTSDGDEHLAVPSDAWAQLLVYRKDLFEKAGLEPPTTYAALRTAAERLTTGKQFGITLASDPADVFTSQSIEFLALGNDCQMVDDDGKVTLTSSACDETFDLYDTLGARFSPTGTETVDTTRASYFSGQSAMLVWSSFVLDELAGLRSDALPSCRRCQDDPTWLARNSGFVTGIAGDSGRGGGYGEIASWGLTDNGKQESAQEFVAWMMSEGYLDWIGITPEGKYPARNGPTSGSDDYTRAWPGLDAGVDERRPLSEIYDPETLRTLSQVTTDIDRWAISQGYGNLLGPAQAELPVPRAVSAMVSGSESPREAQREARDALVEIQESQE